jgi:hypothetical protein
MIGQRMARRHEVTVKSFGEDVTLSLRPLSALEVDAIRQQFPEPVAPRREVDGKMVTDNGDADYLRALYVWLRTFTSVKMCRMLGDEQFGTMNLAEQVKLLQADFSESEFTDLTKAAQRVDTGEVTAEDTRRAQDAVFPTGSGSGSKETSPA